MPNLEALSHVSLAYGPVVLTVIAVFLVLEAVFVSVARRRRERGEINARLRMQARAANGEAALVELRRRRGLTAEGAFQLPFVALNRLLMQSGVAIRASRLVALMTSTGLVAGVLVYQLTLLLPLAVAAAGAAGILLPVWALVIARARRIKRFEEQLPEGIDVMVRSLRAGHPVPVAVAMVAREMPDPIGTEFGMVSDEMTYGMDLETAMGNMRARVGQSDLAMLAVAVSIQAKTGGNLAEILGSLSRMVRERAKMRRKIRALSAEGRFSSIALSIIPLMIYGIVMVTAPSYYDDVRSDALFMPSVYLGLTMWMCGILIMRRMVNFRI
jgi:tight adherence protein B